MQGRSPRGRAVTCWVAAAGLGAALCALVLGALLAQPAAAQEARFTAPGRDPLSYALTHIEIFTDSFDASANNGSPNTASDLLGGTFSCSNPLREENLTFYRDDVKAGDVDWYRFTAVGNRYYTVTVGWEETSPFLIELAVKNPANTAYVYGPSSSPYQTATFFSSTDGSFLISLKTSTSITDTDRRPYFISICSSDNLVTATPTSTPSATPTPTVTPTPSPTGAPAGADGYEPNNTPQQAQTYGRFINVGQTIGGLNFYGALNNKVPADTEANGASDVDWFMFFARRDGTYRLTTSVDPGTDTELFVFDSSISTVITGVNNSTLGLQASNDDYLSLNRGSQISIRAGYDGVYFVKVWNRDQTPRGAGQTYSLLLEEILPITGTPTPTSLPGTAFPTGYDSCEYNGDFDSACLLNPSVEFGANFVPFQPYANDAVDNDFYRLPTKQGLYYTCETYNLSPGVDTNLIVYNKDRVGVGGNDDISASERDRGNFASRFSWRADYTGIYYALVGEVSPARVSETKDRRYTIKCSIGLPAAPTTVPGATSGVAPATSGQAPAPIPPTPLPLGTQAPQLPGAAPQSLPVRALPRPTVQVQVVPARPTSPPRAVAVNLQVYNDTNGNGLPDPGEGVAGVSVWVTDERLGVPLAHGTTDPSGVSSLSVNSDNPVRVSVPLFDFAALVGDTSANLRVALAAAPAMPASLP